VHQDFYVAEVFEHFYIEKLHPLCTPMIVSLPNVNKNQFRPIRVEVGEKTKKPTELLN